MQVSNREQEIDTISRELMARFGHCVTCDRIAAEAQQAYDVLCSTSKVKTFIPILALRRARERVRRLAEHLDSASVDTCPALFAATGGGVHHAGGAQSARRRPPSAAYSP